MISGNKILKFDKTLIIIWLFVGLIISNAFKGLLRDQIINPPKWWFHSIDELIGSNTEKKMSKIRVPANTVTCYSLKKRSRVDPKFEKLLKQNAIDIDSLEVFEFARRFYRNNNKRWTAFLTSSQWEAVEIVGGNEVVTDEIRYDLVHDIRFIRKDYQFSNKIIQL